MSFSTNLWSILPLDTIRAARLKGNKLLTLEYALRQLICVRLQRERSGAVENIKCTTPKGSAVRGIPVQRLLEHVTLVWGETFQRFGLFSSLITLTVAKRSRRCRQWRSFYRNTKWYLPTKTWLSVKRLNRRKTWLGKDCLLFCSDKKSEIKSAGFCWHYLKAVTQCHDWSSSFAMKIKKYQHQLAQAQNCSLGTAQPSPRAVTSFCVTSYPSSSSSSSKWAPARCLLRAMDVEKINNHISVQPLGILCTQLSVTTKQKKNSGSMIISGNPATRSLEAFSFRKRALSRAYVPLFGASHSSREKAPLATLEKRWENSWEIHQVSAPNEMAATSCNFRSGAIVCFCLLPCPPAYCTKDLPLPGHRKPQEYVGV